MYTEALFLFSTLLAWLLYQRGRLAGASVAAAAATLTKTYGITILIPMLADAVFQRMWKKTLVVLVPLAAFLSWIGYQYLTVGNPLAFVAAQQSRWGAQRSVWWLIIPVITGQPVQYLQRSGHWYMSYFGSWSAVPYIFILTLFFSFLAFRVWDVDWRLGLYSTCLTVALVVIGPMESLARLFAFIFPLWLTPPLRRAIPLLLSLPLFGILSVALWYQFLIGWVP